jgi:hypothetical protein
VIRQFAVGNQGQTAVVMLAAAAPLPDAGARHIVGRYDLSVDPPCFRELRLDDAPWKVACSPRCSSSLKLDPRWAGPFAWLSRVCSLCY